MQSYTVQDVPMHSRLPRLMNILGTNYVPSAAEVDQIREVVADTETELYNLNMEIDRIQTMLSNIVRKRDKLKENVGDMKALVSPARRFLPELWVEIFRRCLPRDSFPPMRTEEAPLMLTQVCRYWRDLAITTPSLWSSIKVEISETSRTDTFRRDSGVRKMTDMWLRRSAHRPLSILFSTPYWTHTSITPLIWQTVVAHSSRWRHLTLRMPDNWITPLFATSLSGHLPMLESMTIDITYPNQMHPTSLTFDSNCAPKLKIMTLLGIPSVDSQLLRINWAQLSEVVLQPTSGWEVGHFYTLDDCLRVLEQGVNLIHCSLFAEAVLDIPLWKDKPVLSNVEKLHIRVRHSIRGDPQIPSEISAARIGTFFRCLRLPHLRDLEFQCEWGLDRESWPQAAFLSLLDRLSGSIRALSLQALPIPEDEIIQCLRNVPLLTSFIISVYPTVTYIDPVGDGLLRALTLPLPETQGLVLVPQLHSLKFHRCGRTCTDLVVTNFMESRMREMSPSFGATRLTSFHFTMWCSMSETVRNAAIFWSNQGLDVNIVGRS